MSETSSCLINMTDVNYFPPVQILKEDILSSQRNEWQDVLCLKCLFNI